MAHKEIFPFRKFLEGESEGLEYEHLVLEVIEKWIKFVVSHVGGPKRSR